MPRGSRCLRRRIDGTGLAKGGSRMAERLLTLDQLAETWGVPWDVLLDFAQAGEVSSIRQGRDRFYPESAWATYCESKGLATDEYSEED
jgi:hypothetical protein